MNFWTVRQTYQGKKKQIDCVPFIALIVDHATDVSREIETVCFSVTSMAGKSLIKFGDFESLYSLHQKSFPVYTTRSPASCGLKRRQAYRTLRQDAVMSGDKSGVQTLVREIFTNARYIHCYAHQSNLIMGKFASQNKRVRYFLLVQKA